MNATAPADDPVIDYYDSDYPSALHDPAHLHARPASALRAS